MKKFAKYVKSARHAVLKASHSRHNILLLHHQQFHFYSAILVSFSEKIKYRGYSSQSIYIRQAEIAGFLKSKFQ